MEPEKETRPNQSSIPIIRTFEGDILKAVQSDGLDKKTIISQELDKTDMISVAIEKEHKKRSFMRIFLMFIIMASLTGLVYVYFFIFTKKQESVSIQNSVTDNKVVKTSENNAPNITNIWKDTPSKIVLSTGNIKTNKNYIILNITNYNDLSSYLLGNGKDVATIGQILFEYNNIDNFSKIIIENQELYIADAGTGMLVYGYDNNKSLIIANSISAWNEAKNIQSK